MTLTFDSKVISVFRDLCSNLDTIGNKCAKSESSRFKITFKLRMLADKRYLLRHTPGLLFYSIHSVIRFLSVDTGLYFEMSPFPIILINPICA